jgi:hypothetical protein
MKYQTPCTNLFSSSLKISVTDCGYSFCCSHRKCPSFLPLVSRKFTITEDMFLRLQPVNTFAFSCGHSLFVNVDHSPPSSAKYKNCGAIPPVSHASSLRDAQLIKTSVTLPLDILALLFTHLLTHFIETSLRSCVSFVGRLSATIRYVHVTIKLCE